MRYITSLFYPLLQHIRPSLSIHKNIIKAKNSWEATSSEPQFIVESALFPVLTGWVSFRVKIVSEKIMTPRLNFDFGEGFSESRVVYMHQIDEETYQAELDLPNVPKRIRFDPAAVPCSFTVTMFQVKAQSDILHIVHQFAAIMKHDYKNGIDPLRVIRKSTARLKSHRLEGMLTRLDKEYKQLYPFRMQRATSRHIKYLNWIRKNEKKITEPFEETSFSHTPLISIVMPTYNSSVIYLKKALDSVLLQTYPHWELCIADDASTDRKTLTLLKEYSAKYDNIHLTLRDVNGHISMASNTALEMAKGEYVTFLDHDDKLAPHALLEVVKTLNQKPDAKFIYSDEDKIDEKGRRFNPHFKSDWNPDMFLSQNYITHLAVIKKSLLDEVGYFRAGYEGAQDYDLFLRVLDRLNPQEIVHIEKILYHWRAFEGSTAFNPDAKTYTTDAGLSALKDYFMKKNVDAEVKKGMVPNTYKITYPIQYNEPLVSLIIPTRDGYDILSKCIDSILKNTSYQNYEILIIDNQSSDPKTLAYFDTLLQDHDNIDILKYNKKFNYSAINNFGVTQVKGTYIGLLNNDVEIISNHWLREMVQHALRDDIGAVGAKLYYDDDRIQHAGVVLGIGGVAGHSHKYFKKNTHGYFSRLSITQNYSAITSACLVVKKSLYEEVGGMNEKHLTVAFNDVDLCLKIRELGYRNLWTPYVELYHHESVTRGTEDSKAKVARFNKEKAYMLQRWKGVLNKDPYYNSHLTLVHENFTLRETVKT